VRDIEIITTELVLADLEAVQKRLASVAKDAKRGDKEALAQETVLKKIEPHLNAGKPALTLELTPEDKAVSRLFWLMTDKPTIFACNVKESDLATADKNPFVLKVREYAKNHFACEAVVISAQIESDLIDLSDAEAKDAGVIHSDFERGFIKAETVAYDDLVKLGSVAAAREKGLYRMEGKEY